MAEFKMKVWTCDNHDTYWPVGAASVIVAKSAQSARLMLDAVLAGKGLKTGTGDLKPLDLDEAQCVMLRDGDY